MWAIIWVFIDNSDMVLPIQNYPIVTKAAVVIYNLSAWAFIFLSQSFWWSEKPCLPLLKELGPADVGVSLKKERKIKSAKKK